MSFLSRLKLRKTSSNSETTTLNSPTFINPHSTLGELDFHLINEGRHEKLWQALGAHVLRDHDGHLLGTAFSVWAPNAQAVSLIGDHNYLDKSTHPMVRQ
jgi:1,4-alpha-glucan branching enzyme